MSCDLRGWRGGLREEIVTKEVYCEGDWGEVGVDSDGAESCFEGDG